MNSARVVPGAARSVVFLDRDGTIVRDTHYLARPEDAELLPGAAAAIAELNAARIPVIVVTNQSGIARGYLTQADYELVSQRVRELLAESGASVRATYHCAHHPDMSGPCECRKPGTLLFRQALRDCAGDARASYYVGDRWRDIAPALELGGTGILVPSADTPNGELEHATREAQVAATLAEAVAKILGGKSNA